MNFLSAFYRKLKIGVSGLGVTLSIATIIVGSLFTHGAVALFMIGGGGIWLSASGFTLFDSIMGYSAIKKDIDRLRKGLKKFEEENVELHDNVTRLEGNIGLLVKAKDDFVFENKKLAKSVVNSETQLVKLAILKKQYEKTLQDEKEVTEKIKHDFSLENKKLQELNMINLSHISELKIIKNQYIEENKKMQELNINNEEQIKHLQEQIGKLKELYKNAKELMRNLATAGDMFSEFSTSIQSTSEELNETQDEYDETLKQMKILLENLKNETFDDLDKNNDGIITENEFRNAIDDVN